MRLIGMLDSPYVRRVAISLDLMQLPFTHESISVFRQYEVFSRLNPVVKAPTLITDDDLVLMDSTLIIAYAEGLVPAAQRLAAVAPAESARSLRLIGLGLAACEKTVQLIYEGMRPAELRYEAWRLRVRRQLNAAYELLEKEVSSTKRWLFSDRASQADVTVAVAWSFTQLKLPQEAPASDYPRLSQFAAWAEQSAAFRRRPAAELV